MKWKRIDIKDLSAGIEIIIRPQGLYGSKPIHTPRWANGFKAKVVRINNYTVTVDVGDGGKNVRVDFDDCGYYVE